MISCLRRLRNRIFPGAGYNSSTTLTTWARFKRPVLSDDVKRQHVADDAAMLRSSLYLFR